MSNITHKLPAVGFAILSGLVFSLSAQGQAIAPIPDATEIRVARYELPEVTPEGPVIPLGLRECLIIALERNLGLEARRREPQISLQDLLEQESAFDIQTRAEVSYTDATNQVDTISRLQLNADSTESRTLDSQAGISKRISTGAVLDVNVGLNRSDFSSNAEALEFDYESLPEDLRPFFRDLFGRFTMGPMQSEEYRAVGAVSLTQPLLKDFGVRVNRAQIEKAKNDLERSDLQLKQSIEALLFHVETAYWELVFAYQDMRIKSLSLQLARELLEINRTRARVGTAPVLDVIDAEARVARREEAFLSAEMALLDQKDRLLQLLNLPQSREDWQYNIIPKDMPSFEEIHPEIEAALDNAFAFRSDYQAYLLALENDRLDVDYFRNQKLPRLDVFASARVSGLESSPGSAFSTAGKGDYYALTTGARFEYPLGNRAAISRHQRSRLRLEQGELGLQEFEMEIEREVRQSVRQVITDRKRVEASEKARYFEERKLFTQQRSYELGVATSYEVLEYQEHLASAQTQEIRSRIDYNQALLNLVRSQGILLQQRGVEIEGIQEDNHENDQ